ncbi:MAG: DNA helicase [Hoeflea sp.]|uniref:DNA helicase n=1 Tax=Hoeflea sp. TaxID=1940281 RepID=UPI0032EDD217
MKTSTPIYRLKQTARRKARGEGIPLHAALDRIAVEEGYRNWGHLSRRQSDGRTVTALYRALAPGDLVISAARPGQGKTLLALALAVEAMKAGNPACFFSLDYTRADVADRFGALKIDPDAFDDRFVFDGSEMISAGHIIARMGDASPGTFAVIDYLQLLDQRRENPDLMTQIRDLRRFARARQITFVCISQIDRSYDPARQPFPALSDIRLPNPLDLELFDKACFLNGGEIRFEAIAGSEAI